MSPTVRGGTALAVYLNDDFLLTSTLVTKREYLSGAYIVCMRLSSCSPLDDMTESNPSESYCFEM